MHLTPENSAIFGASSEKFSFIGRDLKKLLWRYGLRCVMDNNHHATRQNSPKIHAIYRNYHAVVGQK